MKRIIAVGLLLFLLPLPTWADTDYICLKACIADGTSHATCLPKCSYEAIPGADITPVTDFKCLKSCADSGEKAGTCLPRCTMAVPQAPVVKKPDPAKSDVHNTLAAPLPVDEIMLPAKKKPAVTPNTDAFCMKFCLAGNLRFQLCQRHCVK